MPRTTTRQTSFLLRVMTLGFLVEIQLLAHRSHALSASGGTSQQVPARCRGDQAAALLGVKRSLSFTGSAASGPATTTLPSWRDGKDCCRWEGVGCDNVTGMVTALNLASRNLAGAVPDSIGNLTSLTELRLGGNSFSGELPSALGNLTNLTVLDCGNSGLSGQIPWLTSLTRLQIVLLGSNKLTGPVPLDGHKFPYLTEVDLSNNSFWGTVPISLFTQPTLQKLCLNMNRLSGVIEEFKNPLATLTFVDLSSNQLTETMDQRDLEQEELVGEIILRGSDDVLSFLNDIEDDGSGGRTIEVEGPNDAGSGDRMPEGERDHDDGEPSGSSQKSVSRRGPKKKLGKEEKFTITALTEDGLPIEPKRTKDAFAAQCGALVRDMVPIIVKQWNKPKDEDPAQASYVNDRTKDALWTELKSNFILPPEEDPNRPVIGPFVRWAGQSGHHGRWRRRR